MRTLVGSARHFAERLAPLLLDLGVGHWGIHMLTTLVEATRGDDEKLARILAAGDARVDAARRAVREARARVVSARSGSAR